MHFVDLAGSERRPLATNGAPGLTTRSKDATLGFASIPCRQKKTGAAGERLKAWAAFERLCVLSFKMNLFPQNSIQ